MDRAGWSLSRGSGGVNVLLLIVINFQLGDSNGLTDKFGVMLIFPFIEYEKLVEAGVRHWVSHLDRRIARKAVIS
jgi:hypothetical protein